MPIHGISRLNIHKGETMKKILVVVSMMLFGVVGAYAAGTAAGTSVSNTATLSYNVAGTEQDEETSTTDEFVVDRKIDFILTNDDGDQVIVAPNSKDQNTTWTLKNQGNADQNFTLDVGQLTNNETIYDDADTNDTDSLNIYYSTDGGSSWTLYNTQLILIAPDANISIRVSADISNDLADTRVMNIELNATAVKVGGATEENTAGEDNQNQVDTVLADGAGPRDGASDATYTAWGGYKLARALLSVTKSSCVFDDKVSTNAPVGDVTKSKRIPGATIIYLFDVNNTGTADASDIVISDSIDDTVLDYTSISDPKADTGKDSCSCSNGVDTSGPGINKSGSSPTVILGNGSSVGVASGKHTCVTFKVDIK